MKTITQRDVVNLSEKEADKLDEASSKITNSLCFKADLSGNIFFQIDNELKPLNICIPELAQVAEFGGSDEN